MKSIQTKGKNKKKNEKLGKVKLAMKNTSIVTPDLSNLRQPIDTSVSDLYQVSKLLENGTDEVKSILSYECNIIYECRTCHSLFRSIINLISHKREYCRTKYDITLHRNMLHNHHSHSSKESITQMYKADQTIIKDSVKNDRILRSQVSKESHKKDLTTVISMLNKKREADIDTNVSSKLKNTIFNTSDNQHIYLESIKTNGSAVYQTVKSSNIIVDTDLMKEQVSKSQDTSDQNTITLKEQTLENQLEKSDSPIPMDLNDEENELLADRLSTSNLTCTICNTKLSTKKTLTAHIKKLHTSQRLCYPCPLCTSIFTNSWSVYRHLYKVHRKNNEQVRKLRSQIQEKAFHKETTATEDLENVCATKVPALENETMKNSDKTRKSLNHEEPTVEPQSYGRRKKRFNTRLNARQALSTSLQYCQTPIVACKEPTIRQSNKTLSPDPTSDILCETEDIEAATNKIIEQADIHSERVPSSPENCEDTSILVQRVSTLSKEDWDMLDKDNDPVKCNSVDNNNGLHKITPSPSIAQNVENSELSFSETEIPDNFVSHTNSQLSKVVYTDISEIDIVETKNKEKKTSGHQSDEIALANVKERDVIEIQEVDSKQSSIKSSENSQILIEIQENNSKHSPIQSNENNQTLLMERIATITNFQKLQCLLCKRKFTSMPNLRRHMAIHIGWNRYRCKLCDFKCFVKCDCVAHCNKIHNAQNNRAIIAELVVEIPQNEYTCNENIVINVMSTIEREKVNDPDVVELPASSCQPKICVDLNNSNTVVQNEPTTATNEQNEPTTATNEQQEPSKNVEHQDEHHDAEKEGDKTETVQKNLTEYMTNSGSGKLDANSDDLKRMVMEVIFGSSDTSTTTQADSEKTKSIRTENNGRECTSENENSTASIDETKETSASMSKESSKLENLRQQRPIRNRMKPLNNDFVYDLKEFRKEHVLFNDSATLHVRKKAKLYN